MRLHVGVAKAPLCNHSITYNFFTQLLRNLYDFPRPICHIY